LKAQAQNGNGGQCSHCYSLVTWHHQSATILAEYVDSGGVGWSLISIIKPHFVGFGNPFS
jgi:hypothetical protein